MSKPTVAWVFNKVFWTATALSIIMEIIASTDKSGKTVSWTYGILGHLPFEVVMALVGALVFWLPVHFWRRRNWKKSTST